MIYDEGAGDEILSYVGLPWFWSEHAWLVISAILQICHPSIHRMGKSNWNIILFNNIRFFFFCSFLVDILLLMLWGRKKHLRPTPIAKRQEEKTNNKKKKKKKKKIHKGEKRKWQNHGKTVLRVSFCALVRLVGNLTLALTTKSPRSLGFLEMVMPKPGYRSSEPGCVGPGLETRSDLPSMVLTMCSQPVRASLRLRSTVVIRSSPARLKSGFGF